MKVWFRRFPLASLLLLLSLFFLPVVAFANDPANEIVEPDLSEFSSGIAEIPDRLLREAARDLYRAAITYTGRSASPQASAELDLFFASRRVYCYYKLFEVKYGKTATREITPTLIALYTALLQKLTWVSQESVVAADIRRSYEGILCHSQSFSAH